MWALLIPLGIVAFFLAAVTLSAPAAVFAVALLIVFVWVMAGAFTAHMQGVSRHLRGHLGGDYRKAQVVAHVIPTSDRVDFQLALDHLRETGSPVRTVFGVPVGMYEVRNLVGILNGNPSPVPIEWEAYPRALGEEMNCATNAVYLLTHAGRPFLAYVRPRQARSRKQMELEIMALGDGVARECLRLVQEVVRSRTVYRGAMVTLEKSEDRREPYAVRFLELKPVPREAIVLPDELLALVERGVVELRRHAGALRQAGRPTRHGLLFHGPPGTGKTLVARYLARANPGVTTILLTGRQLQFIREACRLARVLAPSLVVFEDIDLVATDRRRNRHTAALHELMDEMDGLGPAADCTFILTTNRPEVLEPALAARPGRVDQAVEFPLPDREARRRLFALYGRGLDLTAADTEPFLDRTEGASPAFIQEWFRKSSLRAILRGETGRPLRLTADDLSLALRELVGSGGRLTRQLLGFATGPSEKNSSEAI
jgi:hypothetical protein